MKLSFTKIDRFLTCSMSYKYYYIDGYSPKELSSALFFGGVLGIVWANLCLQKKEELTEKEKETINKDPYEYFDELYQHVVINDVKHDLPFCELVRYFAADYQDEILTAEDRNLINTYRIEINDFRPFEDLLELYKSYKATPEEKRLINYMFWVSSRRKAHYMIKGFIDEILPKIKKVFSIEEKIEIKNDAGDSLVGYIDIRVLFEFPDQTIKHTILDFKTSSSKYKVDAIKTKLQLCIYAYAVDVEQVGYCVFLKPIKVPKIGKRAGEVYADYQILVDKIPDEVSEAHIATIDQVLQDIKDEKFTRDKPNNGSCIVFGAPCPYKGICLNGTSDSYLFKRPKK